MSRVPTLRRDGRRGRIFRHGTAPKIHGTSCVPSGFTAFPVLPIMAGPQDKVVTRQPILVPIMLKHLEPLDKSTENMKPKPRMPTSQ